MVSSIKTFILRHEKYMPVAFFTGGFIWDSLTLGRIDGWYSNTILFTYLCCLTVSLYIFNLSHDDYWEDTFLEPYEEYAPYAIQFFLGGLSSAYVIFFFQSVSLTKTMVFFVILVVLLFSNELLKHRISNKYLQFGAYFFVTFTFLTFFLPILFGVMNSFLFMLSGVLSLLITGYLILFIYRRSPTTREEIHGGKLSVLILLIFLLVNGFYFLNLIPPVPLSLQEGLAAYNVNKKGDVFEVTYEQAGLFTLGRSYESTLHYSENDTVYVYTSIFAPADLKKSVLHHWQWYDPEADRWNSTDSISYEVTGGRRGGFRGYTFKANIWPGTWKVDVTTDDGLVLGVIKFRIISGQPLSDANLTRVTFN